MKNKKICIGKITSPHGIRGEVKVKTFLEDPNSIMNFKDIFDQKSKKKFKFEKIRGQKKDVVIVKIKGCEDKNEADKIRGTELYISRNELPETEEGEFYYNDLIGLEVFEDKKKIGVIKNIYNFGAGEILEITLDSGKEIDVPFNDDYVKQIDLKTEKITIIQPEYV
ncbi:ribosome maturation factor RimM [Pseudomonadota bacterium]